MLDKLKKLIGIEEEEPTAAGPMDHILDDLPLMSDEPQALLEAAKNTAGASAEQKSRGFLLRPDLLKPNQPTPEPEPTPAQPTVEVDTSDAALMLIDVVRYSSGTHDTLGKMYINGEEVAYTLEDEFREVKVRKETRIPAGTYNVTLRTVGGKHAAYWHKFPEMHKGMLWIRDIPNFEYVLIHIGNHDAHTDGCILVGLQPDPAKENQTDQKRSIWSSTAAYKKVYPTIADHLAAGKRVVIRVTDPS
ncbi:MAG: DUF5675 family protein [Bacteroidota bacterium]